jgi:hypothetical protein
MTETFDPDEALAVARASRARIAARAEAPWYAPIYGMLCGVMIAGFGMAHPLGFGVAMLALVGIVLLWRRWTQISGLVVTGYRAGTTRIIAIGLSVALVVLTLLGLALREQLGVAWAPIACGIVGALIAGWSSAAWDRAWRAQLRGGDE